MIVHRFSCLAIALFAFPACSDTGGSDSETSSDEGDSGAGGDGTESEGGGGTEGDTAETGDDGDSGSADDDDASGDDSDDGGSSDDGDDTASDDTEDGSEAGDSDTGDSGDGGDEAVFDVEVVLASDVDAAAPGTVGIVTWSVDAPQAVTEASIEFGLSTSYGMVAPVDLAEPDYRTLLLGMKPDQTYHFRVVASTGSQEYASEDYMVETGPPTNLLTAEFDVLDDAAREPGFLVLTDWQLQGGAMGSTSYILDADGEVVWWYQSTIGQVSAARFSANHKSIWMVASTNQGGSLERVDLDTLDSEAYDVSASHDVVPVEDDCVGFLYYPGGGGDQIHEICAGEDEPRTISDVANQGGTAGHLNTLRYHPSEGLYVTSDFRSNVYGVDRESGDVVWEVSPEGASVWGGEQHGTHLLDDRILIFANSGGTGGSSAIFDVPRTDATTFGEPSVFYQPSPTISVSNLGDVQRLPGGNTMVIFSTAGRIHEVDPSGNVVLSIVLEAVGYGFWRSSLYDSP